MQRMPRNEIRENAAILEEDCLSLKKRVNTEMRMMGWLGKLIAAAVLVTFMSVFTTVYLVDQYVKAVLERWQMTDVDRPSLSLNDLFSTMLNDKSQQSVETGAESEPAAALPSEDEEAFPQFERDGGKRGEAVDRTPLTSQSQQQDKSGERDESTPSTEQSPPQDALPVFGRMEDALVMSAEQFNETRKKLTEADKLDIFSMMMNTMPPNEIQTMSELLEDGITEEELERLEGVLYAHLSEKDIERLLSILNKY